MGRTLNLAILTAALGACAGASSWPDQIRSSKLTAVDAIQPEGARDVWTEYGLELVENAKYAGLSVTAWRFRDPTGAYAAFEWQRALSPQVDLRQFNNFVFRFDGWNPTADEMRQVAGFLPRLRQGELPTIDQFLPKESRVARSERYILGPASLDAFAPKLPPSAAGFFLGAEAQLAVYQTPKGHVPLVLFSYPTPQLARERHNEFMKLPGVMAKRSGPLVAVLLDPPSADDAERLLAKVNYQAQITWTERQPTQRDNIGNLVINAMMLAGLLLALAILFGLGFGGIRALITGRRAERSDAMIRLHIDR